MEGLSLPKALRQHLGSEKQSVSINEAPRAGHVQGAPRSCPGSPNNLREAGQRRAPPDR